ncbi:hypothetical protein Tco_1496824 [Tanacetum coccineum]
MKTSKTPNPTKSTMLLLQELDEEDDNEVCVNKDDEDNDDDGDDADDQDDDDQVNDGQNDEDQDDEHTDSDNDGDDFVHPKLSTQDQEVRHNEEEMMNKVMKKVMKRVIKKFKSTSLVDVSVTAIAEPPLLSTITLPPPPTPLIIHMQQTPILTPATVLSSSLKDLPNFGSLFKFEDRVKALEDNFSEFNQTNQFATAFSSISEIVDVYLANKMHESIKTAVQLQSERLRDEAQAENADFIKSTDDEDKYEEPSAGANRGSKRRRAGKEPESTSAPKEKTSKTTGKSTEGEKSHHKSAGESAQAEEPM